MDLAGLERASARAARLIAELAGGTISQGLLDSNPHPPPGAEIVLRHARLQALYGVAVPEQSTLEILRALGCRVERETSRELGVRAPSWRSGDLRREVDLIEEVARLHGYNHVPAATAMTARIPPRSTLEISTERVRNLLVALGYFECVSDSLIDPRWPVPKVWTTQQPLALDPRSVLREDHSVLRNSLLSSLLAVLRLNQDRRTGAARLFECGKAFLPQPGAERPEERPVLGLVDGLGYTVLADTLLRLQAALELDGAGLKLRPPAEGQAPDFLTPETACRVIRVRGLEGDERAEDAEDAIGWLGVASPRLCQAFDLKRAPALAELHLAALAALPTAPRRYAPLPAQPEVVRDIALVVDEGVAWQELERFAARHAEKDALRERTEPPRFLSVFRGKQAGPGKKSVAFSVVYRSSERSLTDEEVNAAHGQFVAALLKQFHAALRA